jgi:hypothetical protein
MDPAEETAAGAVDMAVYIIVIYYGHMAIYRYQLWIVI